MISSILNINQVNIWYMPFKAGVPQSHANVMYVCLEFNYVPFVIEYRYANMYMQLIQVLSRQDRYLCCLELFIVLR